MKSQPSNSQPPAPAWSEVYSYWKSKNVPQIEIVAYDPNLHDFRIPWFEKGLSADERRGYLWFLRENPKVETACALARVVSKGGPELFAAFAIMTTMRQLDQRTSLVGTVRERIDRMAEGIRQSWHSNAKNLLPCIVEGDDRVFAENKDWRLRVDLAADIWSGLEGRFQVIRQPDWT